MQNNLAENIEFFQWLFDKKNIEMESTIDLTLCHSQENPNIYFPKELGEFFRSTPMKRISRILQLSKFIDNNLNTYHTRFEHCLGTYYKKKNIILNLYKNPKFKNDIEQNNLKLYLIAELIKSAGHDIGHLPLSHILEISVIGKRDFHEEMGKRILLENNEIRKCLDFISPSLHSVLQKTLNSDIFGMNLIDEGNYDIDRFDYLIRDLFYRGQEYSIEFKPFQISEIMVTPTQSKKVPVFDITSVPDIEEFLFLRLNAYKESYFHPITQIRDLSVSIIIKEIINQNEPYAKNLQEFLLTLENCTSPDEINLEEYLSWDDLKFYNELLDVAEFSSNPTLRTLSSFIVPNLNALMNMTFSILDLKHTEKSGLSIQDRNFISRIHSYIHSNSEVSKNLKDPNFFEKIIKYSIDPKQIEKKKSGEKSPYQFFNSQTITGYNTKNPIYIRNSDGKIYTIDNLPNREFKVPTEKEEIPVIFTLVPLLKEQETSFHFDSQANPSTYFNKRNSPNLSLLQVGNTIESYFDKFDLQL